jgi:O-6-methylguanine DNA methyltransferase
VKRWSLGPADLLAGLDEHGVCTAWVEPGGSAPKGMCGAGAPVDPITGSERDMMVDEVIDAIERWIIDPRATPGRLPAGPPFHRACWAAACLITPGSTVTYAGLAAMAGRPAAARAAAQAMARNRLAPLVPCHRVIASSGLGGFMGRSPSEGDAGWALGLKRWLLDRERAPAARGPAA